MTLDLLDEWPTIIGTFSFKAAYDYDDDKTNLQHFWVFFIPWKS